jgi:hypothetical protein
MHPEAELNLHMHKSLRLLLYSPSNIHFFCLADSARGAVLSCECVFVIDCPGFQGFSVSIMVGGGASRNNGLPVHVPARWRCC